MGAPGAEHARRELQGHKRAVQALAWSSSGRKLASGGADEAIRTWSIDASASAKPERSELALTGQGGAVVDVAWHPKREDQLASVTDKYLKIWDTRLANKPTHAVAIPGGYRMAWHPDGGIVAVASFKQNDVSFVDLRKGAVVGQCCIPDQDPACLRFLGNGSTLLVGCHTGDVAVLRTGRDFRSASVVAALQGHVQDCTSLALDPAQKYLATGSYDALVTIWDVDAAVPVATVPPIEFGVHSVSISCDSRRLAFAQEKGPVGVVAVPSGKLEGHVAAGGSHAVAWNPRHAHVLAFGVDDSNVWGNDGRHTDAGGPIGLAFFGSSGGGGGGGGAGSGRR